MRRASLVSLALLITSGLPARGLAPPTAFDHLRAIVSLSPAPEYRRAGSAGMADVADYIDDVLSGSGYVVVRQDFPFQRYVVDYALGHGPLLERIDDAATFKAESAFDLGLVTGADGVTCTVERVADVGAGDCGFIPFGSASPEWKNEPFVSVGPALQQIHARGGAGAIIQGDTARNLLFARGAGDRALPAVVAVAHESELLGRTVRLRAMGSAGVAATGHNVVGVLRPPPESEGYVMLLAHADGWFQAAADNGGGTAAVLRAAELLASAPPDVGVIVAAVDAEEIGLKGSDALADALSGGGLAVGDGGGPILTSDIRAIVNLDASSARASEVQDAVRGLLRTDAPVFSWRAMVASQQAGLLPAFVARFAAEGVFGAPLPERAWLALTGGSYRTDVRRFAELGIPFVWPVVGYPEYHTDGDDLRAVDPADLEALARAAAAFVRHIASLPA